MIPGLGHRKPRRRVGPYTDLGTAWIPPRPPGVALKDRADGNTYYITETAGGAAPPIVMAALPADWKDPIYEPRFGPIMETPVGRIRLYSENGTLKNEAAGDDNNVQKPHFAPVYTRRAGFTATIYKVVAPAGFAIGDPLELEKVE